MARLTNGHKDLYEPGTQVERAYKHGIASAFQIESTIDTIEVATQVIQSDLIDGIEVYA